MGSSGSSSRVPPRPVVRLVVDPVVGGVAVNGRAVIVAAGIDPYVAGVHEVARTVAQPLGRAVRCVGEDPDGVVEFVVDPDGGSWDVVDVSPSPAETVAPRTAPRSAPSLAPPRAAKPRGTGGGVSARGIASSGLGGRLKLGVTAGVIAVVGATVGAVWSTNQMDSAGSDTRPAGSSSSSPSPDADRESDACGFRAFVTSAVGLSDAQGCDSEGRR